MPAKKTKKKSVKRATKRSVARKVEPVRERKRDKMVGGKRDKIKIVLKNLLLFGILFVLSVVIATLSSNELIDQLFWILAILTAFVAVAFLIILLVFLFMKKIKK